MKMKVNLLPVLMLVAALANYGVADMSSDIQSLRLEKEKLSGEIAKLNSQIAVTDSMIKADDIRYKNLQDRYKADVDRRKSEIDSLSKKIQSVASQLQQERNKQAKAKNRTDEVDAKRQALKVMLISICRQLEFQVEQTLPWERETRLDRVKSLTRDLESDNASVEEGFSRIKALINEEIKFGDEVVIVNSPLTRKNGELINAQILRIGNQWMIYCDENASVYGALVRKIENGQMVYEWREDLDLSEREAVKLAIDVKLAKKPPQIVILPVSLSVVREAN